MSARILTREQLTELAALETTPGPLCVGGMMGGADDMRRALEAERDAALEEVARLAAERDGARAEAAQIRATAGALTPGRIRVAALAAIDAVHVAPPAWAETVADDVLARLQASTSKASAPQPDPLPAEGDVWAELIDGEPVAELRALYRDRRTLGIERYGVPLQRGNGRDHRADLLQELLDGMAYAQAADLPRVAAALRERVLDLVGGFA